MLVGAHRSGVGPHLTNFQTHVTSTLSLGKKFTEANPSTTTTPISSFGVVVVEVDQSGDAGWTRIQNSKIFCGHLYMFPCLADMSISTIRKMTAASLRHYFIHYFGAPDACFVSTFLLICSFIVGHEDPLNSEAFYTVQI